MPVFLGAVGVIGLLAGARIRAGKGPLMSPLYGPSYRATVLRFLLVASAANFVLLALANAVAR